MRPDIETMTIPAGQVAALLGISDGTFRNKRGELEARGFPTKLPGMNCWSRPAVLRWIETNGESYQPADDGPEAEAVAELERRYAPEAST